MSCISSIYVENVEVVVVNTAQYVKYIMLVYSTFSVQYYAV